MQSLSTFIAGLLFGLGLLLSGMTDPSKVQAFLDLGGAWDPSLILVMASAIAVSFLAFTYAKKRSKSWLGQPMLLPTSTRLDKRLATGSTLFGIGWGLAGFCPAPALISMVSGHPKAIIFCIAMLTGMAAFEVWTRRTSRST